MEFLTLRKKHLKFAGDYVEARTLLQIPKNDENIKWQIPLKTILDAAKNVPTPWDIISVNIIQKGDLYPEEITVTLSKDNNINMIINLEGLHLVHANSALRCNTCPLPRDPKLVPDTVKQAHIKFLELLVQLANSVNEGT